MPSILATKILDALKQERESLCEKILNDGATSFAEYRHMVGTLHGYNMSQQLIMRLDAKWEDGTDD